MSKRLSGVWVDGEYVGYLKELKGSKKVLLVNTSLPCVRTATKILLSELFSSLGRRRSFTWPWREP
jgi:hypothetical protein